MRSMSFLLIMMLAAARSSAAGAGLEVLLDQLGIDEAAESLQPAPIPGFLELTRGMQVLYVSVDGGLIIDGDVLSVSTETNLTEERRAALRRDLLRAVDDDDTLIVPASAPMVARIIVFMDTDCPYCLLLHRQQEQLSQHGIEIQYLFYPRSGPSSASFEQAVSVWCSNEPLAALERALEGTPLPEAECANPMLKHYELARQLDLKGTPAVITAGGTLRYGIRSSDEILGFVRER